MIEILQSAARVLLVRWEVDSALLIHVIVRFNAVVIGHLNAIFARELAVGKIWVSCDAGVWQRSRLIEDIERVDIHGLELSRVNL